MAESITIGPLNTSNTFIKYQLIVTDNGNGTVDVVIQAWRTNSGYTTARNGNAYLRIGSTNGAQDIYYEEKAFRYQDTPVKQYSYTEMYSKTGITIDTSLLTDNKIYVQGSLVFNGSPQYTSSWQGGQVTLGGVINLPVVKIYQNSISTTSMSAIISTSMDCDEWWYDLLDETYTTEIRPWTKYSTTVDDSSNIGLDGLDPNTSYYIRIDARKKNTPDAYGRGVLAFRTEQNIPDIKNRLTLFDSDATDFSTNGLGTLTDATDCVVIEERNGTFELEMDYPINGQNYDKIDTEMIILAKPNPYAKPQPFRIYGISKPINGIVSINAAHISYDLSACTVSKFEGMSVSETLSDLQKKIENPYKRSLEMVSPFDFWSNVSGDRANKEFHNYKPTTVKSILGGVDGSILDTYGGEYEWDVFKVKLWQARGSDRNVHIRYGKNMTQYKQDESSNTVYTAVKPFWYKEQTNNGNKTYTLVELEDTADTPDKCVLIVNEPKYSKVLLLDMTSAFDDAPSISDLKDLTDQYIAAHQLTSPEVTITVSFVNLENSKEYDDIKNLQEIRLCDIVHVDFPRYNSFRSVKCEKTEYNVLAQRYDSITLGTIKTYLPGTISKQSQDIQNGVTKDEFAEAIAKT